MGSYERNVLIAVLALALAWVNVTAAAATIQLSVPSVKLAQYGMGSVLYTITGNSTTQLTINVSNVAQLAANNISVAINKTTGTLPLRGIMKVGIGSTTPPGTYTVNLEAIGGGTELNTTSLILDVVGNPNPGGVVALQSARSINLGWLAIDIILICLLIAYFVWRRRRRNAQPVQPSGPTLQP